MRWKITDESSNGKFLLSQVGNGKISAESDCNLRRECTKLHDGVGFRTALRGINYNTLRGVPGQGNKSVTLRGINYNALRGVPGQGNKTVTLQGNKSVTLIGTNNSTQWEVTREG